MIFSVPEYFKNIPDNILIEDVKCVAKKLNKETVTMSEYCEHGAYHPTTIVRRIGSWFTVLELAGLEDSRSRLKIPIEALFSNLEDVWMHLGRRPKYTELKSPLSKYCAGTYDHRFGSYSNALKQFTAHQKNKRNARDLCLTNKTQVIHGKKNNSIVREQNGTSFTYGTLINFRGLQHAPVNENGVIFLFSKVSDDLGFLVESIRSNFPDCECKYKIGENKWKKGFIEFEYKASNFKAHGHDESKVDFIVCWVNDWDDCSVKIVELQSELQKLLGE